MKNLIKRLTGWRGRSPKVEAKADHQQAFTLTAGRLEIAREDFAAMSRKVAALVSYLRALEDTGEINQGQLALHQRELKLARRQAQAAFQRAEDLQSQLEMLDAARAAEFLLAQSVPLDREDLETLHKQVFVAGERRKRDEAAAAELASAVYGDEADALEELSILERPVAARESLGEASGKRQLEA